MRKLLVLLFAIAVTVALALPAGATAPADVGFEVESSLLGAPGPFTASGPAVAAGVVCDAGFVFDAAGKATGSSPTGFNFQGVKHFVCDDGSGEFFVNLQARIDFRKGISFQWNVLRGTGDYANLHGAGSGVGIPGVPCGNPNECVFDIYFGALHID